MTWPWLRRSAPPSEAPWVWPEPEPSASSVAYSQPVAGRFDGSNFFGGLSGQIDEIDNLDYYTLRSRSAALFYSNLYARGLVRCQVTNVINTGLSVECVPDASILGMDEQALVSWSEMVEARYGLFGNAKRVIDAKGYRSDGGLQRQIYQEAFISGDVLVICRINPVTRLPQVQVVPGDRVETPPGMALRSDVVDGVQLDDNGQHLGFWIYKGTRDRALVGTSLQDAYQYVPARGPRSGRHTAWLVYGVDKREDGVRGEPALGIGLQAYKSILDFRTAALDKAKHNAMIVGFTKRERDIPPSMSLTDGAVRKRDLTIDGGAEAPLRMHELLPGMWFDRLQPGEEPMPFSNAGTDVQLGPFEETIVASLAWSLRIPPEIARLTFSSNYSASQAALQEYIVTLGQERSRFSQEHCQNLFEEWFVSEQLLGKFQAGAFLEAYADPTRYDESAAWLRTDWYGVIKPPVDVVKQTRGYQAMVDQGWITNDRVARELSGSKYTSNCRRLREENALKVEAMRPLWEAKREFGPAAEEITQSVLALSDDISELRGRLADGGVELREVGS